MKFLLGSVFDGLRNLKEAFFIARDSLNLMVEDALDCWGKEDEE